MYVLWLALRPFQQFEPLRWLMYAGDEQKVTPRESKPRISRSKGHLSKRTAFVREVVKEVSGYVIFSSQVGIGAWMDP